MGQIETDGFSDGCELGALDRDGEIDGAELGADEGVPVGQFDTDG